MAWFSLTLHGKTSDNSEFLLSDYSQQDWENDEHYLFYIKGYLVQSGNPLPGGGELPTPPTLDGYNFVGWGDGQSTIFQNVPQTLTAPQNAGESWGGDVYPYNEDNYNMSMYCVYEAISYIITYIADGQTIGTQTWHPGDTITPPSYTKTGYDVTWNIPSTITADTTLTATLTVRSHTLNVYLIDRPLGEHSKRYYGTVEYGTNIDNYLTSKSLNYLVTDFPANNAFGVHVAVTSYPETMPDEDLTITYTCTYDNIFTLTRVYNINGSNFKTLTSQHHFCEELATPYKPFMGFDTETHQVVLYPIT